MCLFSPQDRNGNDAGGQSQLAAKTARSGPYLSSTKAVPGRSRATAVQHHVDPSIQALSLTTCGHFPKVPEIICHCDTPSPYPQWCHDIEVPALDPLGLRRANALQLKLSIRLFPTQTGTVKRDGVANVAQGSCTSRLIPCPFLHVPNFKAICRILRTKLNRSTQNKVLCDVSLPVQYCAAGEIQHIQVSSLGQRTAELRKPRECLGQRHPLLYYPYPKTTAN